MESEPWLQQKIRRRSSGPDGVEAWRVAFAACFISFISAGIARTSGILYVEVIDIFHVDRKQASLPFTVRTLTRNLFGPVVGILGQKYGVRPVIIVGGFIGTLSAAACFFVEDIFWMTVVWGFFNGIGAAMITTLTQASIGEHFEKHKSTASGMGFSGGCVGSFIFPAVLDFLLNEYSLGGTFLFIAGIIMHVIPAAIIMKRPTWLNSRKTAHNASDVNKAVALSKVKDFDDAANKISQNNSHKDNVVPINEVTCSCSRSISNTATSFCCKSDCNKQQLNPRNLRIDLLKKNRQLIIHLLINELHLKCSTLEFNQTKINYDDSLVKEIDDAISEIITDGPDDAAILKTDSISYKFPKFNTDKNVSQNKNTSYVNGCSVSKSTRISILKSDPIKYLLYSLDSLAEINRNDIINAYSKGDHDEISKVFDELQHIHVILVHSVRLCSEIDKEVYTERANTFCTHIKTAVQLHTKPLFLLICLCRSSHMLTFFPMLTTVVDFSRDKGFPEGYGKYVIAALSGGDLIGRLFTGWITDKQFLSLPRYMLIFMMLEGISTALLTVTNSSATLIISLAIYGLLQGCVFIQHPVLVSRYLRNDEQSIALGCLNFFPGILGFSLPFYIGYFRDTMGSYNGMFYVSGFIGSFIGLLWLSEPYLLKISQTHSKRVEELEEATV